MKKLYIKISIIVLTIVIVAYPLDLLISTYLKKSTIYAQGEFTVWNDIYNKKIHSEGAIYGSSRAWTHFNPTIITEETGIDFYNYGMDGQTFSLQYLRHKEILSNLQPPKYIILSLDPFSLEESDGLYNIKQFLPYMLWNRSLEKNLKPYSHFKSYDFTFPLIRYMGYPLPIARSMINIFTSSDKNGMRVKGYYNDDSSWDGNFEKIKKEFGEYKSTIDSLPLYNLNQFISECKENSIKLVMVYSPVHRLGQEYIEGFDKVRLSYQSIAEINKIPFLDFTEIAMCENINLFKNSTHLNRGGAEQFSRTLGRKLKQLLATN